MTTNTGWIEKFKIPAARLEEWKQEAGPQADLLSWCLLNGKINEGEYLEWACRHYELPIVESNFFSLQPDLDLWERVHGESQWKSHLIPLHEWEGILLIACVEPVALKLNRPHRFVLAPASSLNFLWTTLGHSDVIKKPVLAAATEAPVVDEAPAGFAIKLNMPGDDAPAGFTLGGSTPPVADEAPAGMSFDAPAGFTLGGGEAPAGFSFEAPAGISFDSALGEETAPGVATEEQMPDGFAKMAEPPGLNFTLGGGSVPTSQVGEETQDIPIEVTQDIPIEVTQDMPIEFSAPVPPPLTDVAERVASAPVPPPIETAAPAIPPIPKLSIPVPPPKTPVPETKAATTSAAIPMPPPKPAEPVKTAVVPPIPVPSKQTTPPPMPNAGVVVAAKPAAVPAEKHVAPGKPAVANVPNKNVKSVDIPQSEDTPLPSRPGVTDFHECYTFEEATDLAFSQMKGTFQKAIMLVFQGGQLRPWKWTGNVQYAGKGKASYINLGVPSIFRIPYNTSLPYHGYVAPNPVNDEFFQEFNGGVIPKHVTIMPLKVSGNIAGMLMGITDEKIDLRTSLRKMEGIAENVSQAFSRIRSHKVAG